MGQDLIPSLREALAEAARQGADACDLFGVREESLEARVRDGRVEKLHRAAVTTVGLRAFVGRRSAVAAGSDLSPAGLSDLASSAVRLARLMQEDPAAGLPEEAPPLPNLDDAAADVRAARFSPAEAIARARALEAVVVGADPRVKTTGATVFAASFARVFYLDSRGRTGTYPRSCFSLVSAPVAEADGQMQTGHWGHFATSLDRLESPETVGREAVRRTVRRLGGRKVTSCRVPVVFEAQEAASLLSHLAGAVSGPSLYRKMSFLTDALDKPLFPADVEIVDDPLLVGGLASRPFDGEGVLSRTLPVVSGGVLRNFLLDAYAARRLSRAATGAAARAPAGAPAAAPSNLILKPGTRSPRDVVLSVDRGLYVTDLMGQGVNLVTGDYSRGACGLWIEGGEFAYPVQEVTISGNLKEMFAGIAAVADDLDLRLPVAAPTLLVGEMTVAGT